MSKTLKDLFEVYRPKAKDEADFVDKHVTIKHKDRNGNGDDVFNGNTKTIKRKGERKGYDAGDDEKVYEEVKDRIIDALINAAEELGEDFDLETLDAIAEEVMLDELSKDTMGRYIKKAATKIGTQGVTAGLKIAKDERSQKNFDTIGKRERGIARAVKKLTREEVEDLDELSKKTLGAYIKKASPNSAAALTTAVSGSKFGSSPEAIKSAGKRFSKRTVGIDRAVNKLTKEEVEEFEEAAFDAESKSHDAHYEKQSQDVRNRLNAHLRAGHSYPEAVTKIKNSGTNLSRKITPLKEDLDEGLKHDRYMRSHGKKARGTGSWAFTTQQYGSPKENEMHFTSGQKTLSDAHKEAASKLGTKHLYVMEETENLDELSVNTLDKYRSKARKEIIDADANDDNRTYNKRAKGYRAASRQVQKKLTKEDIINNVINTYIPEDIELPSNEERLVENLDAQNVSEQHIHILLSMFESLNEQNQNRMLETSRHIDGVNSLLDFAITNRGE